MNEDSLLAIITDVERFCDDHSLALFHCFDRPTSLQNRIMWEKSDLAEMSYVSRK